MTFSNRINTKPPSRERAAEMIAEIREHMERDVLREQRNPLIISPAMFERGKREGWIVQRDGRWRVVDEP